MESEESEIEVEVRQALCAGLNSSLFIQCVMMNIMTRKWLGSYIRTRTGKHGMWQHVGMKIMPCYLQTANKNCTE